MVKNNPYAQEADRKLVVARNLSNSPTQRKNAQASSDQFRVLSMAYGLGHNMQQLGQGQSYGSQSQEAPIDETMGEIPNGQEGG